jgi:hypothetical protein
MSRRHALAPEWPSLALGWPLLALGAASIAFFAATAGAQATRSHSHGSVKLTGPAPLITMERTQCKGMCAEYKLSIYADGTVIYEGKANVSKAGFWRATVPKERVDELAAQFDRIGFTALQPSYGGGLSQNPVAILSYRHSDSTKTVSHDEGSPFSPKALTALEDEVDNAVQSVNWVR